MLKQAMVALLLAILSSMGAACSAEGDDHSGEVSVSPADADVTAGDGPVTFTANVGANAGRITWSLDGPGALTAVGDSVASYRPPLSVAASTSATVSATLVYSGAKASATITIHPPGSPSPPSDDSLLRISPPSANVYAGSSGIAFSAVATGSAGTVTWSLVGPGTLSFPNPQTAHYLPPPTVVADTSVVLRAQLSNPPRVGSANILVQRAVGNLAVNIGVPPGTGLRPTAFVAGPGGFSRSINASETFTSLVAGTYTVTSSTELFTGAVVSTVYLPRVTGSPATVSAGTTAVVSIAYSARPGSGHLWVVDQGAMQLRAYGGGQLGASGRLGAEIEIPLRENSFPISGAVGSGGDLWILVDPFTLAKYASAHLGGGRVEADTVLGMSTRGGFLDYASGLAFDSAGNLWLASNSLPGLGGRRILKYGAAKLLASAPNPAPDVVLSSTANWYPTALAFDRSGNLWLADAQNDRLLRFSASQLMADGTPIPTVAINNTAPGTPMRFPADIAFDLAGNLWVANMTDHRGGDLIMYSSPQIAAGGSPNPSVRIERPTLPFARGLAFDPSGGLWMAAAGALAKYSASQLSSSGSSSPEVFVQDIGLAMPTALVFNPPPQGTPLYR